MNKKDNQADLTTLLIRELCKKTIFKRPARYVQTKKIRRTVNYSSNFNLNFNHTYNNDYDNMDIKDENVRDYFIIIKFKKKILYFSKERLY